MFKVHDKVVHRSTGITGTITRVDKIFGVTRYSVQPDDMSFSRFELEYAPKEG